MWHIITSSIKLWNSWGRRSLPKWVSLILSFPWRGGPSVPSPTASHVWLPLPEGISLSCTGNHSNGWNCSSSSYSAVQGDDFVIPASSKTGAYFYHNTHRVLSLLTFVPNLPHLGQKWKYSVGWREVRWGTLDHFSCIYLINTSEFRVLFRYVKDQTKPKQNFRTLTR